MLIEIMRVSKNHSYHDHYECSECGTVIGDFIKPKSKFCPVCKGKLDFDQTTVSEIRLSKKSSREVSIMKVMERRKDRRRSRERK